MNVGAIDRVVFIIVDAKPGGESQLDKSAHPFGIHPALEASTTNPVQNYSAETVEMGRLFVRNWNSEQADVPGEDPPRDYSPKCPLGPSPSGPTPVTR